MIEIVFNVAIIVCLITMSILMLASVFYLIKLLFKDND